MGSVVERKVGSGFGTLGWFLYSFQNSKGFHLDETEYSLEMSHSKMKLPFSAWNMQNW